MARKAPYEVMQTPDRHPPFAAKLSLIDTYVRAPPYRFHFTFRRSRSVGHHKESPIAFTRNAPPDGTQNIIWAFSRMLPGSDDPDAPISIHREICRGVLNLTRIPTTPAQPPHSHSHPEDKDDDDDEKAENEGENHDDDDGRGGFASFVYGALCTAGCLLVLPSGALVVRYAKAVESVPASPPALIRRRRRLHRGRHARVAVHGRPQLGHGTQGDGAMSPDFPVLTTDPSPGSWDHRIPAESQTSAHGALLAGLGATIVLFAFFETWLGLVLAGRFTLVWSALLFYSSSLPIMPSRNDGTAAMRIPGGDAMEVLLAAALFLAASPVKSRANPVSSKLQKRQFFGSAHDSLCSDVMCIECDVDGAIARYTWVPNRRDFEQPSLIDLRAPTDVLRSTGELKLGWIAIGFGRNMADSSMVVVWPSRGTDGDYDSVTLSQLKSPYETMPTPDPNPPFAAELSLSNTSVTGEYPQIAFTRRAPNEGMQNIIWVFSRTPPGSADADAQISIHHRIGRGKLNLTRTAPAPAPTELVSSALPPSALAESSGPDSPAGHEESDGKAKCERESETYDASEGPSRGGFASLMHGAFCMAGFLLVISSGVLMIQHAKVTGSPRAFHLHRLLQLRLAGGFIAGGTLAYLFIDDDASGWAVAHKVGSANLLLLYLVQCAYGSWVYRTPWRSRTRMHRVLLAGLGATIVLLEFYQTWLGLVSAGHDTPVWLAVLMVSVVLALRKGSVVMVKWRFRSVQAAEKGEGSVLETQALNDELADGGKKL
ncbi:hypothetical protein H4582DRAFT_2077133 [Lactarius indigo]|nr:hypothetical protein H4582DRAFT_2077133 [Lactarius indigo]